MPKYFRHQNLSSFIRQLNIYDFKKISNEKDPDEHIYTHVFFHKNKPELLKNIKRKVQNHDQIHTKDLDDVEKNPIIEVNEEKKHDVSFTLQKF